MRMHQGINIPSSQSGNTVTVAEYATSSVVIRVRFQGGSCLFLFRWEWVVWFKGCSFTEESPTGKGETSPDWRKTNEKQGSQRVHRKT